MGERGPEPFAPSPEQRAIVTAMAALGIRQDLIAISIRWPVEHEDKALAGAPIAPKTLRKSFRKELTAGMAEANALVANALFLQAIKGNVGAIAFWLKNRAPDDWKDKTEHLHGGEIGSKVTLIAGSADAEC